LPLWVRHGFSAAGGSLLSSGQLLNIGGCLYGLKLYRLRFSQRFIDITDVQCMDETASYHHCPIWSSVPKF
jgi:hypothetical protein